MVLEEPLDADEEELTPSFDHGVRNIREEDISRSKETTEILVEFEKIVVPRMISSDWMSLVAKSKSYPYYNNTEQNLNAHIFPGVEIAADVVEQAPGLYPGSDLRDIIAMWTIHDIHKIVKDNNDEFDISLEKAQSWIDELRLTEFNDKLSARDYHSCAVALHNQGPTNIDDSTNRFTELRPALRLIDATVSISKPSDFIEQAERPVSKVFGKPNEIYLPACHEVDFDDSVVRNIVSKNFYEYFAEKGYMLIDIRDDGVLYAKPEDSDPITDMSQFVSEMTGNSLDDLRNAYQIYTNKSFLGGDIGSPSSRSEYSEMPRVYEISDLSHICLSRPEIIQRIVQAAVEQQNKPWNISKESRRQIDSINQILDESIPKHSMIEGLAALVHTVYREILPDVVNSDRSETYESTMEGAIMYVFACSEETQRKFLELLSSEDISASPVNWPYKYIIARDLHERFTSRMSKTERQEELTKMILDRLTEFEGWEEFGTDKIEEIRNEFSIRLATNCRIDGDPITGYEDIDFLGMVKNQEKTGECYICDTATSQNANNPSLLSNRDFDVLERDFVTIENGSLTNSSFRNVVPRRPICITCQLALSVRSQQFNTYSNETDIHVTVHPINSTSVASYTRFRKVLKQIKTKSFADMQGISYRDVGNEYEEIMENYLEQPSSVDSLIDREKAFDVGQRMDEASSQFSLPDSENETIIRGVSMAVTAALISGVSVCITKKPQLYIKSHENTDVVRFGPELEDFKDIIDDRTEVMSLPKQMKIIDRVVSVGDKIGSPNVAVERYSTLGDEIAMSGTRLYNNIKYKLDDSDIKSISVDVAAIDALLSEEDSFSNDLLVDIGMLGRSLGEFVECNSNKINRILDETLTLIESSDSGDEDYLKSRIKERLQEHNLIDIGDVEENKVDSYIDAFLNIRYKYGSDHNVSSKRQVIIGGAEIRAIIKSRDQGDRND